MANTLASGLTPSLYQALNNVINSRKGFVGAVKAFSTDISAERLGLGQTVRIPVAAIAAASDIVPGQLPPDSGGAPMTFKEMQLTKSRMIPIQWTGEEQKTVGDLTSGLMTQQFELAFNKLAEEVEVDAAVIALANASTFVGTSGTIPFGVAGDLSDFANVLRGLEDNGAPGFGNSLIIDSASKANIRGKQSVLFKANEAGTDDLLRNGTIGRVESLDIRDSKFVGGTHTNGTGSGFLVNNTGGYAAGATTITVDTGTGTILAGDRVTIGGVDYVVASTLAANTLKLTTGLHGAVADNAAITLVGASSNYTARGVAMNRLAVQGLFRLPAVPMGGDGASEAVTVTDPVSGLTFELRIYRQYRQIHMELGLAWGFGVVQPEWIVGLMG